MNLIPNRHAFAEGESGNNIGDGGGDMFDGGNILITDHEEDIEYSNNKVTESKAFGAGSKYITKKYEQGLFMLAADMENTEYFQVFSNYGRDGKGDSEAHTFKKDGFTCYALRIWGTDDAGVNKMIIFKDDDGALREEDASTAEGYL
jgi:hypothetical protein